MLSPGGARGVEKAELNGNVDSDYDHGGSSRTYVLHRARCSQEDDQLLRQGCERSGSPGRQGWGNTLATGRLDRATLAVARKMVAYLLAVDRGQRDFVPFADPRSAAN